MLNKVILMGRLCADPDFRQTQSGIAVCRIRVAIDYTDGNGVKHYSMDVQADNVTFGETRAAAQANGNYTAPSNQSGYQYQPQYQQQPSAPQAAPQQPAAAPASQQQNNSVPIQLGDLSDFEEILSDGEVPF